MIDEKYCMSVASFNFLDYLQNIPMETINHWKRKNGIDVEPISPGSTASAQIRMTGIVRISSSSYIWR